MAANETWRSAAWYRALSLTERLREPDAAPSPGDETSDVDALERLRAWKAQKPFERDLLFAKRLGTDGMSELDLLRLLAEPAERLRSRIPRTPAWLAALQSAFSDTPAADKLLPLLTGLETEDPFAPCLPALAPLLQRGLASVERSVEGLQTRYGHLPVDGDLLPRAFLSEIVPIILFQISKPVVLEMHLARREGRLRGETPEARFQDFIRQLSHERLIEGILLKYPVLARQLVVTVDQWAEYLCEFLTHLGRDWEAIRATFAAGGDPGRLVELEAGKGDPHRRGRSVMLLRFASGLRLLYKPRALAVDAHFQELLAWLNALGAEPRFRPLVILDRGGYGWSEFVATTSCTSREEVVRFYERQGGYLALLYVLDAADLHNENLIAAGEHPALIDLEALFHSRIRGPDPANLAADALDRSVSQVGILPTRVWSDEQSPGVDMSGLGGQAGQLNPHRVVRWVNRGTDEMRVVRERVELPVSDNRPLFDGREVALSEYRDALVAGFVRTYRLLCRNRDALLAEQVPRFAQDEIRVVVRSTNIYGLLWYESFHPDLLRDGLDRDRFFDRLWIEAEHRPCLAEVIPLERRDLLRGDIPAFTTRPDSRTLLASEGEALVDFLDAPSLDVVRQRIELLGEDDLAKQRWIVEASLATVLMGRESATTSLPELPATDRSVTHGDLLSMADAVGRRLNELALQDDAGAYWLGIGPLDGAHYGLFPAGVELYAGAGGIALFLAYLGAITDEPSHTRLARRALTPLRRQVGAWVAAAHDATINPLPSEVGGFDGLGSLIYVLTHLGVLWGDRNLLDEAVAFVERLPPLVSRDERLDIIYGSAGCILSLLTLNAARPCQLTIDVAMQCGDRLLATARSMPNGSAWGTLADQPPLGGFSHGTAGIAFSLLRLAAVTGEDRFRRGALGALAFDRSLFVPEPNNWVDLRVFPPDERADARREEARTASMVAWCHGAAGIGLGRLAALDQLDDRTTRDEIEQALTATIDLGFEINHSLCHGALGNIEFLLLASQVLNRVEDHEALHRAVSVVASSIEANGWVSGVPLGVETPGLMTGLAGIGYELLRLAEPGNVPSVLLLAPPVAQPLARPNTSPRG